MPFRSPPFWPPFGAVASGAVVAVLQAGSRILYPLAALQLIQNDTSEALWLLGAVLISRLVRAAAVNVALEHVREELYSRVARAIGEFPAVVPVGTPGFDLIEAQVARGLPWVEAHYCRTWPSLVGSLLSLPVVWLLTVQQVGFVASLWPLAVLLCAVVISLATARFSERAADLAWSQYQAIASTIEQGLRGRVELSAHDLTMVHREKLRARVVTWSRLDRRARIAGALTGVAAPLSALALGVSLAGWLGYDLVPVVVEALSANLTRVMGNGLLLAATLPLLFDLSGQLAQFALELPYLGTLSRFLSVATLAPRSEPLLNLAGDIRFEHVEFVYPGASVEAEVRVFANFSWPRGQSLALVGPNGCGKTTVALGLIGALKPRAGVIRIEADAGAERRDSGRVAFLSQDAYFDETDSVRQSIQFAAPAISDEGMASMLAELGLVEDPAASGLLDRRVGDLSSGQRRIVALARVLLRDAEVLILDEPEANLATGARDRVARALQRAKTSRRLLILTHDPAFAAVADRVLGFDSYRTVKEPSVGP